MPLRSVPRPGPVGPIPTDIRAFLRQAGRRIRRYHRRHRTSAFVPCDFGGAYGILRHLAAQAAAAGTLFCEWGSGFGVVTCLAALLEFDASGIGGYVAQETTRVKLANGFGLPVRLM